MSDQVFDVDSVGRWTAEIGFPVDQSRTIEDARATNDPIAQHLDGTFAAPIFAVVPPFRELAETTMAVVPDDLRMRILHGEQDDDAVAKKFGLSGIIIHGLCTMAFTSHAVLSQVAPNAPERLKRLAVRFSSPARPGDVMTTSIWKSGLADGRDLYAFESVNDSGTALSKDGLAEVEQA